MVDTGLIYRLVAGGVLDAAVDPDDREAVLKVSVGVLKDVEVARTDTGGVINVAGRPLSELRLHADDITRTVPRVARFVRGGFWRVTRLLHFARETGGLGASVETALRLLPYSSVDPTVFADTLIASYEGSLDCPELDGIRTADEVIAGYRGPAGVDPAWYLAVAADGPTGVLLLAPGEAQDELELAYLGVLPSHRRSGRGTALTRAAVRTAAGRGANRLTTGVDERNVPAIQMYKKEGFVVTGRSVAYLRIAAGKKNGISSDDS
jgi:ribosomal protein S18 acetylase RimI-like enzyme